MPKVLYTLVCLPYSGQRIYFLTFTLDLRLDNVLVNYNRGDTQLRFTDVELGDCGSATHINHKFAKDAAPIGAPIWRSPEAMLQLPSGWNTSTDIWSFGLCVRSPSKSSKLVA